MTMCFMTKKKKYVNSTVGCSYLFFVAQLQGILVSGHKFSLWTRCLCVFYHHMDSVRRKNNESYCVMNA